MKKYIPIVIIALFIGLLGFGAYAIKNRGTSTMMTNNSVSMQGINREAVVKPDTSSVVYKQYAILKGEDYDRLFLGNMIAHHQGAVAMAKMALITAQHQEIKTLAQAIVSAQTSEITTMTDWQRLWNYPATTGSAMMDHSAMGMEDENAGMMSQINSKTSGDFDKMFLSQMILHHQSAINMAASGPENAKHQEVKDLTAAIVTAQTKEIKQMRQWQRDWSYTN